MRRRQSTFVQLEVRRWIAEGAQLYDRADQDEVSRLVGLVRSMIGQEPRSSLEKAEAGVVIDFEGYRKPNEA